MNNVTVIGGGIVGLASAYKILRGGIAGMVRVLEKESAVALHQSTHNSGVLHAGLYYAPGSLKARLARTGLREMVAFCREHGIPHEQCGKLVVATDESEIPRLQTLFERGTQNGLAGLRRVSLAEMREIEPHVAGIAGVHVPEEGIADYRAVCDKLRELIAQAGGEIVTGARVRKMERHGSEWVIDSDDRSFRATTIVTCGGLHADRLARLAGEKPDVKIVPFRGEYWTLAPEAVHLVRNLVYPVPDPSFPFLGVHFTRMIGGGVEAGPNAVLALAREGYNWRTINLRDLAESLAFPGLWRFAARFPRVAAYEVARSFSKRMFLRSLQRLVPELKMRHLTRGPAGVRAQLMTRRGDLVQDFHITAANNAIHVINAPSPGATASLAIGDEITRMTRDVHPARS